MRRSQSHPEHAEAVSRRLATLSAELAAVREEGLEPTRVRPSSSAPLAAPVPVVAPAPVAVLAPGRHAARRRAPGLSDRWGLARLGLTSLGPWHVAVVMTLVAVTVGVAAWLAVGSHPEPVSPDTLRASNEPLAPVASGTTEDAAMASSPTGEVTVDVAGRVRRPGIAVLPAGSRVVDALDAAGGARRGVDTTSLNLARVLVDGEQLLVGVAPPPGVAGDLGEPGVPTPSGALVNINTADQTLLETLPGVGPVTAGAIIGWRTDNGAFSSVDELVEVDGIGEATLAKLAPLVTI